MPSSPLHQPLLDWYAFAARDLPWRRPGTTPWGVLVSEFMLQQTPVARVLEPYERWLARWPTPALLAAGTPADAIREWGRLGYPRRAVRLHAAATYLVQAHGGQVPRTVDELRRLPGVGEYTAAAVMAFAYGERIAPLDTNVRRVLARAVSGLAQPSRSLTSTERRLAEQVLPPSDAARWAVASMELGATVCTARAPRCTDCPIVATCAWHAAGRPPDSEPQRRQPAYDGSDRQARGRLLAALREATGAVGSDVLLAAWPDRSQAERALAGLVADGLAEARSDAWQLAGHDALASPAPRIGRATMAMPTSPGEEPE
jgi:A/G-specific adenine glycosylase